MSSAGLPGLDSMDFYSADISKLYWAFAVNSLQTLQRALLTTALFLEVDVPGGPPRSTRRVARSLPTSFRGGGRSVPAVAAPVRGRNCGGE